jgi:hypothetical protein
MADIDLTPETTLVQCRGLIAAALNAPLTFGYTYTTATEPLIQLSDLASILQITHERTNEQTNKQTSYQLISQKNLQTKKQQNEQTNRP